MNSRERVTMALSHQEADCIPLDLGGSGVSGIHVSSVYKLRQALGLDSPGTAVKVVDPSQMLGEVKPDLLEVFGIDVVPLRLSRNVFGYKNTGWKPWTLFDGTPVLVPEGFNTEPEANGDILMYPEGDKSVPPSGRMPKNGWYFDAIIRQEPLDEDRLNVADNLEEFKPVPEDELQYLKQEVERLYNQTDKAIFASFGGTSFGDIARVPGTSLKHPKGIRDIEEWYISIKLRPDYIYQIFERQAEIALQNLARFYEAVGDKISVIMVSGTDFGTQTGPFIAPETYRSLYQPFYRIVNEWIHTHTKWKTFIHSCGSIVNLLDEIIDSGFDIINPVQCSAAGMDPRELKQRFGNRAVFWGGGVDTQQTLPFGTPEQIRAEVRERIEIFGPGGGFVFNSIHNIQANIPVENIIAYLETIQKFRGYPISI